MSVKRVQVASSQLFKDIRVVGDWHSRPMVLLMQQTKQDVLAALAKAALKHVDIALLLRYFSCNIFKRQFDGTLIRTE